MDDGKNDSELRRKEQFLKRILPCFPPGRRRQPPKSTTMNGKVAPQQDVSIILLTSSNNQISEFRIPNIYNKNFVLIFFNDSENTFWGFFEI